MKGYTKDCVDQHQDRAYSPSHPAVNVKCYHFPSTAKIEKRFGVPEEVAEKAAEFAFDMAREIFWEDVGELVEHYFPGCRFWQEGRSGGWLVVDAGDPEEWDGVVLNRWALLERAVKMSIKWLCSEESVFSDIEANRWAEAGAQEYNFIDLPAGGSACMVDIKARVNEFSEQQFGIAVMK